MQTKEIKVDDIQIGDLYMAGAHNGKPFFYRVIGKRYDPKGNTGYTPRYLVDIEEIQGETYPEYMGKQTGFGRSCGLMVTVKV